jgi:hypothetical protein
MGDRFVEKTLRSALVPMLRADRLADVRIDQGHQ